MGSLQVKLIGWFYLIAFGVGTASALVGLLVSGSPQLLFMAAINAGFAAAPYFFLRGSKQAGKFLLAYSALMLLGVIISLFVAPLILLPVFLAFASLYILFCYWLIASRPLQDELDRRAEVERQRRHDEQDEVERLEREELERRSRENAR